MKVRIIADSTADVTKEIMERLTIVPLSISFGTENYIDGVTITRQEFYEKLQSSKVLPRTSQPSPEAFAQAFEEAARAGESVVCLTVSSKLSGTYQSARIAAQDYPKDVYVVDTMNVATGEGVLVEYALQLADEGKNAQEIVREIECMRERVSLFALVDTLEYLQKGGRVSKAVAFAGGLLSIKPFVGMKNGVLEIMGKARGSKQGCAMMDKTIDEVGGIDFQKPVLLSYTGTSDLMLKKYIEDSRQEWKANHCDQRCTQLCGVIGTHAGPGAVVVTFFRKN